MQSPAATYECLQGWQASLSLGFVRLGERCVLAERKHSGPLVVQKPLYPEGQDICHVLIVHPPGGIAGGDRLRLEAKLGMGAHALITTPGAGKWYKANGRVASQTLEFALQDGALLEWLPQETIVFDQAQPELTSQVSLTGAACYAGWEILCLGRQAARERFMSGRLRQRTEIFRDGARIWGEYTDISGGGRVLDSPAGLKGKSVSGTFLVAGKSASTELIASCREVPAPGGIGGVTALPQVLAARYLGDSAEAARAYFEALWAILRPWYAGKQAVRPRIWNT